jgi:hypothetical protein
MRFSQANWITIDDAARTLTCARCEKALDFSREPLGVLGFVRVVARAARRHFGCSDSGRRPIAIVRDIEEDFSYEAEERAVREIPMEEVVHTSRREHKGVRIDADAPFCLHCGKERTGSRHQICTPCQRTYGLFSCKKRIERRRKKRSTCAA